MTTTTAPVERAPTVPSDTFGNRLMLARAQAGHLSIRQASELCGIGRGAWANWERGAQPADYDDLVDLIASMLKVDKGWLRDGGPLAPSPPRRSRWLRGGSTREQHQPVDPLAARVVATIGETRPQRHGPVSHKPVGPTAASPVPKSRPGVRVTRTQPVQPLAPCVR